VSFKLKSGVAVYGGFAGTETKRDARDWEANATILSGDIGTKDDTSDNSSHVVSNNKVDHTAALDGFTITAGNANTDDGGGMVNVQSSPTLTNTIFTNNQASSGGGMYSYYKSSPTLTNVTFSNNTASNYGGGLYQSGGTPTLTDVTFSDNTATNISDNTKLSMGGGMYNYGNETTLTNVTFSGNSATDSGGGLHTYGGATLTNVTFSENTVTDGSGGGMYNTYYYGNKTTTLMNVTFSGNSATDSGGGLYNYVEDMKLTNVVFSGNSSDNYGGGMYNKEVKKSTFTNVTFSGNKAYYFGGGLYNDKSTITIQNSLFWGNTVTDNITKIGYQLRNFESTSTVQYSLIEGSGGSAKWDTELGTDGGNNLDKDPLFVNPIAASNAPTTDGNYRLLSGSPAIDAGNNEYVQNVAKDLDGNSRIFNTTVDMGAYEIAEKSYAISGVVKDKNGTAVAGVTITTSGGHTTKTASDGTYSLTVPKGSYTLTPTLTSYFFTPKTRSVAVTDADKPGQDFTATKTYVISGVVKDTNGKGVASVLITATGGYTATTASDGTYRLTAIPAGSYTLTPALQEYMFDPTTRSVVVTDADKPGQDFTANQDTVAPKVTVTPLTTNNPTPTLTGSVDDPDATLLVTIQRIVTTTVVYSKTYTAVNNGNGTWSVDITEKLDDGSYDVITVATDPMKNSATATTKGALFLDTVKPKVTIKVVRTDSTMPQLTGKIDDPTAVLTVTVDSTVYTATNKANGTWSLNITDTLAVGTYDVVAVAKDAAGNVGQDTTIDELEITDTQATSKLKLEVSSGYNDLQLEWNVLPDIRVTRYVIMFGKGTDTTLSKKATVEKTTSYYDSVGLNRGESYCYQVIAQQANGDTVEISNRACGTYGSVALQIPDTYAGAGQEATVPVNIRNANGLKIASGSIYLDYDSTVLEFVKVENTALSEEYMWSDAVHTVDSTTNRLVISAIAFPAPELYGNGSLFWITFKVLGKDDDTSLLNLREFIGGGSGGCEFYTEMFETIPLELIDGIFTVGSKYLLGDASGNGTVGAEDALLALQFANGKKTPTADELIAADVNGNGKVDAGDVSMILYYASHQKWPFPIKKVYLSAFAGTAPLTAVSVTLQITDVQLLDNQTAQASIYAKGLTDWAGGDFTIAYDPTVIQTGSFTVTTTDSTSGFTLDSYDDGQGGLHLSLASGTSISGDGAVVALTFKVKATSGTSQLVLAAVGLYDVYGRDFEQSALQQTIAQEDGTLSLDAKEYIFLPYIVR
jgi:predicted outer membrane repeat protein